MIEPAVLFESVKSDLIRRIGYANARPFLGLVGFDGAEIIGSDGSRRAATKRDVLTGATVAHDGQLVVVTFRDGPRLSTFRPYWIAEPGK